MCVSLVIMFAGLSSLLMIIDTITFYNTLQDNVHEDILVFIAYKKS